MKILLTLALMLQVTSAFSFGGGTSLTWQKLALEEKVQRKFNNTLSSLLKDNQYLVEVETEISEPPAPNFGPNGHQSGSRVSDISLSESRGDYIAFSKMGLEVPVLEKFLDEDRTKLMNLYRFNEAYDLFKNISELKVTVFLSDKIPQDLVDIVKKAIQNSKLSVSGIKPTVKFESLALEWVDPAIQKKLDEEKAAKAKAEKEKLNQKKTQEEPKIWTKDWYEWASRWGNAFGLIFGALIVGIIALTLFKQWKAFMEKFAALQAAANKPAEEKEEEKEENEAMQMAQQNEVNKQEDDVAISQGFDRFQQCLEQHTEEAVNMVRSWLNEGEEHDLLALRGIAQMANAEQMETLMNGLTETQRDKWKGLLGKHLETAEINAANKHIFQEVVKSFLVPSRVKDGELLNLIMELSSKTTCEFFDAYENQIGILMNLLSPTVIGKILAEVDDETADSWLNAGSDFSMKHMEEKLPALKEALISFKAANSPSPFAHRIMSMIPTATPAREGTLYRALAKAGNAGMVFEIAKKSFPSELVLDLPAPFLKEVLQSYPVSKRVEFLYSRPEEVRESLLDMIAEAGSPARDMMDMELENLSRDPARGAAVEGRAEEIWQEFVKNSRVGLAKNASYAGLAEQLIKQWGEKLSGGLHAIKGGKAA